MWKSTSSLSTAKASSEDGEVPPYPLVTERTVELSNSGAHHESFKRALILGSFPIPISHG